jgi:putative transposase
VTPEKPKPSHEQVGIDVGLKTFAYFSTDEKIENPRFFRSVRESSGQSTAQTLPHAPKEPRPAEPHACVVARVDARIRHQRDNFIRKVSRKLVNRFRLIVVEALVVRNMLRNSRLSKSRADARLFHGPC